MKLNIPEELEAIVNSGVVLSSHGDLVLVEGDNEEIVIGPSEGELTFSYSLFGEDGVSLARERYDHEYILTRVQLTSKPGVTCLQLLKSPDTRDPLLLETVEYTICQTRELLDGEEHTNREIARVPYSAYLARLL